MSIQAITAALALRGFSSSEKLLLIAWSNYADENFQCYPSNRRLCEDTGLSDRQIRRIAGDLSERGLIVRKERFRPDKSRSTDLVTLVCLKEKAPDTMTGGVGTPCQGGGDTMAEQNRSINHSGSKEPSSKPARGSRLPSDLFPEFWERWPVKKSRKAAHAAYLKALKETDHGTLVAAVDTQRRWPEWGNPKYIPHASTWLNKGSWADEPRGSEGAGMVGDAKASGNRSGDTSFADIAARRKRERESGMALPGGEAALSGNDLGWDTGAIVGQCAGGDWQG